MSMIAEVVEVTPVAADRPDSLAARVAARREDRLARRARRFVLDVPGFEGLLAARYRTLSFEVKRKISLRHEGIGEDAEAEVAAAADTLVNACVELLEVTGKDADGNATYRQIGVGWHPRVVQDVFGVELGERATQRDAVLAALGSDDLMAHFAAWAAEETSIVEDGERAAVGESTPPAAA